MWSESSYEKVCAIFVLWRPTGPKCGDRSVRMSAGYWLCAAWLYWAFSRRIGQTNITFRASNIPPYSYLFQLVSLWRAQIKHIHSKLIIILLQFSFPKYTNAIFYTIVNCFFFFFFNMKGITSRYLVRWNWNVPSEKSVRSYRTLFTKICRGRGGGGGGTKYF